MNDMTMSMISPLNHGPSLWHGGPAIRVACLVSIVVMLGWAGTAEAQQTSTGYTI